VRSSRFSAVPGGHGAGQPHALQPVQGSVGCAVAAPATARAALQARCFSSRQRHGAAIVYLLCATHPTAVPLGYPGLVLCSVLFA